MRNGYDQFFKQARQNAAAPGRPQPVKKTPASTHHALSEKDLENHLKKKMGMRTAKKTSRKISWKLAGFSFFGVIVAAAGFLNHDKVEKVLSAVEINFLGSAKAQSEARTPTAVAKTAMAPDAATETIETKEELDHLSSLREKKKELDVREEEINRVESELQKQKEDLETRLRELRQTREQISKMLEDRVKADDQKVETLVAMYSNMRAPQAAKVFETLDEDLAIDILGRMKKKNAADIMNLLKPEKAQVFSEKFAGYKRK